MNKTTQIFLLFFLVALCSCTVQQRIYRRGIYVPAFSHAKKCNVQNAESHKSKKEPIVLQTLTDTLVYSDSAGSLAEIQQRNKTSLTTTGKHKSYAIVSRKKAIYSPPATKKKFNPLPPGPVDEIDFREEERIRRKAKLSLILGICSIPFLVISAGAVLGVIAIIAGSNALKAAKKFSYRISGIGMAKAGLILGIVCLSLIVIAVAAFVFFLVMAL